MPTLVVVYEEQIHHYTHLDDDIRAGNYRGLKDFCEAKINERNIKLLDSSEQMEAFIGGVTRDLRPRMILFSEQPTPTKLLHTLASQFRGEVEFGFAEFSNDAFNQLRVNMKIAAPSVVLFKSADRADAEIIRVSDLRKVNDFRKVHFSSYNKGDPLRTDQTPTEAARRSHQLRGAIQRHLRNKLRVSRSKSQAEMHRLLVV